MKAATKQVATERSRPGVGGRTAEERRAHVQPAWRANRYRAVKRYIERINSTEPDLTTEQRADLAKLLMYGGAA